MDIRSSIIALENDGVFRLILPFLLIFTITYAALEKVKVFERKAINLMIALVLTLTTIIPHTLNLYPTKYNPVLVINNMLSGVSLLIVGVFAIIMVLGLFGMRADQLGGVTNDLFSVLFLALVNTFIYLTYPYLFPLTVWVSVMTVIYYWLFVDDEPGFTAYIPSSIVVAFIIVVRTAFPTLPSHLPSWLIWLESPAALTTAIGIGVFLIIIKAVTKD